MIKHTKSNIVQYNEYYPFGMPTKNSWTRENSSNNFTGNGGSEMNTTSGWYDTFYRGYDPALGRFHQVDPKALYVHDLTPYNFANNKPSTFNDPNGDFLYAEIGKIKPPGYGGFNNTGSYVGSEEWASDGGGGPGGRLTWCAKCGLQIDWATWVSLGGDRSRPDKSNNQYFTGAWIDEHGNEVSLDPTFGAQVNHDPVQILHASAGWDWFLQTTSWTSDGSTFTIKHAVIVSYNTNENDWGTEKYGKVTSTMNYVQVTKDGKVTNQGEIDSYPDAMKDLMNQAEVYHNPGSMSILRMFIEFEFSFPDKPGPRLNSGPPHERPPVKRSRDLRR